MLQDFTVDTTLSQPCHHFPALFIDFHNFQSFAIVIIPKFIAFNPMQGRGLTRFQQKKNAGGK